MSGCNGHIINQSKTSRCLRWMSVGVGSRRGTQMFSLTESDTPHALNGSNNSSAIKLNLQI